MSARSAPVAIPLRMVRLGDLAEGPDAFADGPFGSNLKTDHYSDSGARVIRLRNIGRGEFLGDDAAYVPLDHFARLERHHVRAGDVIVAALGDGARPAGRACLVPDDLGPALVKADCFRVRLPASRIDPNYLVLYLNSPIALKAISSAIRGATRPRVNLGILKNIPVLLPSLSEQKRIAAEAQMTRVDEMVGATFRHALSDITMADSERVELGSVCSIEASQIDPTLPQYSRLLHVSGENIESATGRLLEVRSAHDDGMISGKYLFEPGDVLYSKLRPYLRKVALVDFHGLCSADMYPLRAAEDRLDATFLKWLLLSDEFTAYADEESRRARMPKLNREQLFSWIAPLPSLADQRRIAQALQRRLDAADAGRALLAGQAAEIGRLPAALLRRAFQDCEPGGQSGRGAKRWPTSKHEFVHGSDTSPQESPCD